MFFIFSLVSFHFAIERKKHRKKVKRNSFVSGLFASEKWHLGIHNMLLVKLSSFLSDDVSSQKNII